ncbi:MAG TPA: hypothetical protein VEB42_01565, partial [Chitinophagaceae bacterium]|nr:hypothetical protein [Chitinophagaceae bacterium]
MKKLYTLAMFLMAMSLTSQAQFLNKTCGQEEIMNYSRYNEPEYFREYQDLIREFNEYKMSGRGSGLDDTTYTVQVVVHVVYYEDNAYENVPDSIIISQLNALNRDYNKLNADTSDTRDIFKPLIGNPKIKFVLATEKPNGDPTTGITRKKTGPDPLGRGFGTLPIFQRNVKRTSDGGTNAWDTKRYVNIWVCDLNRPPLVPGGLLGGYATPPSGLDNWPDELTATIGGPN